MGFMSARPTSKIAEQVIGGVGPVTHALGGLFGGFTTFFLIVILGIYFALEPDIYRRGLAWMFPLDSRPHLKVTLQRMGKALRMLLFGRMIGMVTEGVATWILLAVYGVPMSALLGILTGLLVFLPNIGAPLSGLMMVLVGFSGGTDMGIYCIIVYLVVQTVDGNVIVPMVAKKTADLAPALVLGAQLIFGVLFGILGLALADPIVAMIKIALERQAERNGSRAPATRRTKPSPATNCLTANFPALHEPQRSDHAMSAKRSSRPPCSSCFWQGSGSPSSRSFPCSSRAWPLRPPMASSPPRADRAQLCRSRAVDCPARPARQPRAMAAPARNGPTGTPRRAKRRCSSSIPPRSSGAITGMRRSTTSIRAAVPTCWSQPRPAPSTMPVRSGCRTTGRPRLAPS
jgi:hypothetical protein